MLELPSSEYGLFKIGERWNQNLPESSLSILGRLVYELYHLSRKNPPGTLYMKVISSVGFSDSRYITQP